MNSAPTEVLVDTEYITITIDGGIRMPSAPEVVMTPAPKRLREARARPSPAAGSSRSPPPSPATSRRPRRTARRRARRPGRGRRASGRPSRWRSGSSACATPPWVRKLPARMKNGIAMISNFSMPVNSFSATDSIGTWVRKNRNVSTVRPSEIEIGMPVSISATSSAKMMDGVHGCVLVARMRRSSLHAVDLVFLARRRRRDVLDALDLGRGRGAAARRCGGSSRSTCRKRKHIRYEPSGTAE